MNTMKPETDAVTSERRLLVRAAARALWNLNVVEGAKMSADEKKKSWEDCRASYVEMAGSLIRRLEKRGYKVTK